MVAGAPGGIPYPHQLPGPDTWLLMRRSPSAPDQLAYAPPKTAFETLVPVASTRYTVEQGLEVAKGETGLDQYAVRFWHSWYRPITRLMLAHACLASIKLGEQENTLCNR